MGLIGLLHTSIPSPTVFTVGGFSLRWYGLLLALAAASGYLVARREWSRRGWSLPELEQLSAVLLLGGLLGARFFDVFVFEWWYFKDHLGELLSVWRGGLAFHGGLLAATALLIWWCRRHQQSWLDLADTFAPALALAQAIGRWGNYANQELFGLPTSLPWGIPIVINYRPDAYLTFTHFHPVFLYESLALFAIAAALFALRKRITIPGRRLALYLFTSGLVRFVLEFIRVDEQVMLGALRVGTIVAAVTAVLGVWLWVSQGRRQIKQSAKN